MDPAEARAWAAILVAIAVAWIAGRWTHRTSRAVAVIPPYDALASRIVILEEQVGTLRNTVERLEDEAEQARDHAAMLHRWIDDGATPPPPTRPDWL